MVSIDFLLSLSYGHDLARMVCMSSANAKQSNYCTYLDLVLLQFSPLEPDEYLQKTFLRAINPP